MTFSKALSLLEENYADGVSSYMSHERFGSAYFRIVAPDGVTTTVPFLVMVKYDAYSGKTKSFPITPSAEYLLFDEGWSISSKQPDTII